MPALDHRGVILSLINFMLNSTPPYYVNSPKRFLLTTFGEDRVIGQGSKLAWPPCSVNITPVNFWLWIYFRSFVYYLSPSTLAKLNKFYVSGSCCNSFRYVPFSGEAPLDVSDSILEVTSNICYCKNK
ncbi:uncharacterized protein TNCV_3512161 [Trichonephila clavipes]|nr:uncharacterized protein TNCV_3512161 [Trichonephila clavipes]